MTGLNRKESVVEVPVSSIRPYEKNPRDNSASVKRVAESIRQFGFLQPIVCDGAGVILAGHTRYQAALQLGLDRVPVLYAGNLTAAQAKAYRLADNKVGESSKWITDMLCEELEAIELEAPDFDLSVFGFEQTAEQRQRESWHNAEKRCGLKKRIMLREKAGFIYTSFFSTGKTGWRIEEIKSSPDMVPLFADNLCDYISHTFGGNLSGGGWCICTTPRRRHPEGFHFATEISRRAADYLRIPFCDGAIVTHSRGRIDTDFELKHDPAEHNVILYDDIISTGTTIRDSRALLIEAGHTVFPIISIRNQ